LFWVYFTSSCLSPIGSDRCLQPLVPCFVRFTAGSRLSRAVWVPRLCPSSVLPWFAKHFFLYSPLLFPFAINFSFPPLFVLLLSFYGIMASVSCSFVVLFPPLPPDCENIVLKRWVFFVFVDPFPCTPFHVDSPLSEFSFKPTSLNFRHFFLVTPYRQPNPVCFSSPKLALPPPWPVPTRRASSFPFPWSRT